MSVAAPRAYDAPFRAERSAFLWLLEREVVRFLKIWRYSIAGQVLSALLFLVVFGIALGDRISAVGGIPYERFILPGLVVQAVLTVGYINGTTSLYEAKRDRYLNDVLASPLRWWEVNLALVLGGVVREVLTAGAILAIAVPLTGVGVARPLVAGGATLALLVAAAQVGVLVGTYGSSLDHIYSLETLVVLPLAFLGGTFYAIDRLPGVWSVVSRFDPALYFVEGFRIGLLGEGAIPSWVALLVASGLALGLSIWSLALFRSGARLKP
jgi:ABC-2 type transport system permease protein